MAFVECLHALGMEKLFSCIKEHEFVEHVGIHFSGDHVCRHLSGDEFYAIYLKQQLCVFISVLEFINLHL